MNPFMLLFTFFTQGPCDLSCQFCFNLATFMYTVHIINYHPVTILTGTTGAPSTGSLTTRARTAKAAGWATQRWTTPG